MWRLRHSLPRSTTCPQAAMTRPMSGIPSGSLYSWVSSCITGVYSFCCQNLLTLFSNGSSNFDSSLNRILDSIHFRAGYA